MNAIIKSPVHFVQGVYVGALSVIPNAPKHLLHRIHGSMLNSTVENAKDHFLARQNYIHGLYFQICTSTTLRDDAVGNLWAVYPSGKLCLEIPWFYPFGIVIAAILILLFVSVFRQAICQLFKAVIWMLTKVVRSLFGGFISSKKVN